MLGFLLDGGWMMLPLLACSIAVVALMIDRIRAFRAANIDVEALRKDVRSKIMSGDVDGAIKTCEASTGPVAATLLIGLQRYARMKSRGKTPEEMEMAVSKTMEDYAPKALHGLENRLGAMVLIASISPLLGMTGTVTGMIRSFSVMAEAAGLDPGAVAGGISEALITTAAGLLIAIPAVVVYNIFTRRLDEYTMTIENGIADVVEAVGEQ